MDGFRIDHEISSGSAACPETESGKLRLSELIDAEAVQSLMNDFYQLAHIPMGILDLEGNVLVGVGWQDLCTKFHRVHPQTRQRCVESDTERGTGIPEGEYCLYKCKNQIWDIVTPIYAGGRHIGNLFSGQFFLEEDDIDEQTFREQARQYGFDETEYVAALLRMPKLPRATVERGMSFFIKLSRTLSQLGYSNLKLAQAQKELHSLNESLEQRVSERTAEVHRLAEHLRALAADLTQTEHRERRRMATILHDHIQQLLVGARMHIRHASHLNISDDCRISLNLADTILSEAVTASRSLTVELCPPVLRDAGLIAGLGWLAQRMREQQDCEVELLCDSRAEPRDEDVKLFLFEAVRELVFNASKHAGVKLVRVSMARDDNGTRITVEDHGKGFDPGALQQRDPSAAGFGLFSIQQRLSYLGGRMDFTSAPGQGASITLYLPTEDDSVKLAAENLRAAAAGLSSRNQSASERIRVMVVDDHKVMREGLSTMLRLEPGLLVVGEAEDGEQAVEMARSLQPQVVLMDVTMPKMDGVEATRIIREQCPAVKVIGLSMHIDPTIANSMRQAGAADYLSKGEPIETVIEAIQSSIGPVRQIASC